MILDCHGRIFRVACSTQIGVDLQEAQLIIWSFHFESLSSAEVRLCEIAFRSDVTLASKYPDRIIVHALGDLNFSPAGAGRHHLKAPLGASGCAVGGNCFSQPCYAVVPLN